jgi:fused signal recognition particle receptor
MGAGSRKKRQKREPGEKGPSRRSRRKEKAEAARPPRDPEAARESAEEPAEETAEVPVEEHPPPAPQPEIPSQPEVPPAPEAGDEVIILEPVELESEEQGEEPDEEPAEGEEVEDGEEEEKLRRGLFRSRRVLSKPFTRAATRRAIDPEFWQEAEEALIAADTGVACATLIVERARKKILARRVHELEGLKEVFREEVVEMLESFGSPPARPEERPHVIFVVGVNGVGKTTTCAKIGFQMKERGEKVLFAAADTFRAAGVEQMEMWSQRVGAPVVRHKTGGDPAAVVFDSIESAQAKGLDVVIVDTAGRLHTKTNLMEELAKMRRVAERRLGGVPEAILVIDATTGQNGVTQARIFGEALEIGSIALTKMDGSAKGGVVLAIGQELGIPVSYIGVGEGMRDLRPFDAEDYARALF